MPGERDEAKSAAARPMNVGAALAARANLECLAGDEKGQTFRVAPGITVVGRDASCDVVMTGPAISRQHFRIERRGEEWVLRNGTVVNKKSVDEAVLADGDEIRLGAKARLRFAVEQVAAPTAGRPQFRPRGAKGEGEAAADEAADETPPSLFQRRKRLFIGLGVYLAACVVFLVAGLIYSYGRGAGGAGDIPILGEDDMIRPTPTSPAYRVVKEAPEGVWYERTAGDHALVPHTDLTSGKATKITGLRRALDVKFKPDSQPLLAERCKREAMELYRVWRMPGKEANLFGAVRRFQQALGYYGGTGYFPGDPDADKIYRKALDELIAEVRDTYSNAVLHEKAGEPQKAWESYRRILRIVYERNNPIFENVNRRISALKYRLKRAD